VFSSPSLREGGEEGDEWVTIAEEDADEDPVEVIAMLDSPPRPTTRQMMRI
jgi:hypothetical protein